MAKQIKTSAIMRAIVADASRPGGQRDAASDMLGIILAGRWPSFAAVYEKRPYTLASAAFGPVWRKMGDFGPAHRTAVERALVDLAQHYGIQPTEDA